ncbi:MAG: mechanosensitive ion channel family protein [Isosphaeraceae bacterium]
MTRALRPDTRRPMLFLLLLLLLRGDVSAQPVRSDAAAPAANLKHPEGRSRRPRPTEAEIARWNDRSTPRRMLETFFFAILCYDLMPELIVNAVDCLDFSALGNRVTERDAALMAHQLNSIIDRQDIALFGIPDDSELAIREWSVVADPKFRIDLNKQPDGRWRFSPSTVKGIPSMQTEAFRGQREVQEARMKLVEGRTDPEATMRSFLAEIVRRDFTAAARCLDLRDVPSKLRAVKGPELARKLAFVIQRCAFVFPQDVISDPDGWRFVWHSNHRGRVMLDRVRQHDDKDAWLFSRATVMNLDAMVEGFRSTPPDPRYEFVGVVVNDDMLLDGDRKSVAAPDSVPRHLASARSTLRTFLEGLDELDFDDQRTRQVLSCLDLEELSAVDRSALGLRTATKLDAVVRHLNIDLLSVPDSWEAETQSFGKEQELQVVVARHPDGAWRFDADTVARVPEMFDRLSPEEKSRKDRASRLGSARQTVRTLIHAASRGDSLLAAQALDLGSIPQSAQAIVGPILAHKLKFVLDRIGSIQLQEIPNELEGPRHVIYRGPVGLICVEPASGGPRKGQWLFTHETVAQIEAMFEAALNGMTAEGDPGIPPAGDPVNAATVGFSLRGKVPGLLRRPILGLETYQWLGLVAILIATTVAMRIGWLVVDRLLPGLLRVMSSSLGADFVHTKIRPIGWLVALWLIGAELHLLDLPTSLWSRCLPSLELAWAVALAWSALRMIDLGMAFYTNSESLQHRRNLSDMIVPTAARFLKLSVLVVAASWIVYLIGSGEWVTRLLAGLGLVGLAASLAAQDTLKNFFGTLLLIGEHPFKLGDYIVVNGMEGTVECVGFRSTWLRTPDDSLLTIPNSIIANASIDNRGARNHRRFRMVVAIPAETPADCLLSLRDGLREFADAHPSVVSERIDIHFHATDGTRLDLLVNCYLKVQSGAEELEARDELAREILRRVRDSRTEPAEPRRGVTIAHPPEAGGGIPKPSWAGRQGSSAASLGGTAQRRDEP